MEKLYAQRYTVYGYGTESDTSRVSANFCSPLNPYLSDQLCHHYSRLIYSTYCIYSISSSRLSFVAMLERLLALTV